jgi:hypothetical protein
LVAGINWHYYGVFRTNEFRSGEFVRAYGALARIEVGSFHRFVPIPLEARQKAYEVSPAAKELSSSLDGVRGHDWAGFDCTIHPIQPPCDLQVGVFVWALRDAAADSAHYSSAPETEEFYSTLANEIDNACNSGKIHCRPLREALSPPFRWEYVGETALAAKVMAKLVFDMGNGEVGALSSRGSAEGLSSFADLTNEYVSPSQDVPLGQVDGWVAAKSDMPSLEVIPATRREVKSSITLLPATDVLAAYPNLKSTRFTLRSDCPLLECELEIHSSAGNVQVPFEKLVRGAPINTPNLILFIDSSTADQEHWTTGDRRRAFQMRIAHRIGMLYGKSSRFLTVLATIGMLIAIVRYRVRRPSLALLALAIGSVAAVASRILLLSYIDATSFTTYFLHYLSPATPFLIAYIGSGLYVGYSSLSARRRES